MAVELRCHIHSPALYCGHSVVFDTQAKQPDDGDEMLKACMHQQRPLRVSKQWKDASWQQMTQIICT